MPRTQKVEEKKSNCFCCTLSFGQSNSPRVRLHSCRPLTGTRRERMHARIRARPKACFSLSFVLRKNSPRFQPYAVYHSTAKQKKNESIQSQANNKAKQQRILIQHPRRSTRCGGCCENQPEGRFNRCAGGGGGPYLVVAVEKRPDHAGLGALLACPVLAATNRHQHHDKGPTTVTDKRQGGGQGNLIVLDLSTTTTKNSRRAVKALFVTPTLTRGT